MLPPVPSPVGGHVYYKAHSDSDIDIPKDAKVVAYDHVDDLAIIEVTEKSPPHAVATLRDKPLALGEEVQLVGHPMASMYSYRRGLVALLVERIPCATMHGVCGDRVMLAVPSARGDSGAGVFDAQGRLVGIVSLVVNLQAGAGFSWAVGQDLIGRFLAKP
jgi:serine protease Do